MKRICSFRYAIAIPDSGAIVIRTQDLRRRRNVVTGSYHYPSPTEDRGIQRAIAKAHGCSVIFRRKMVPSMTEPKPGDLFRDTYYDKRSCGTRPGRIVRVVSVEGLHVSAECIRDSAGNDLVKPRKSRISFRTLASGYEKLEEHRRRP